MGRLILTGPSRCGTTISSKLLTKHPEIWMTNEVRMYMWSNVDGFTDTIYNNIIEDRRQCHIVVGKKEHHNLPPHFSVDTIKDLNHLPVKDRILSMEQAIFDHRYRYFGDKGLFNGGAEVLASNDLKFDLIIIYRDPRDVVTSVLRYWPNSHFGYETNNPPAIASTWLNWLNEMRDLVAPKAERTLFIKFEDYVDNPGLNASKIENFLGITGLQEIERQTIDVAESHKGNYRNFSFDWANTFSPEVIGEMSKLGYI